MTGALPAAAHSASALAPAKINLTLEVLGRRADGFHEIRTWMLALDLCDRVDVRANTSGEVRLAVSGVHASPDIPTDARNLAWRAAAGFLGAARERALVAPGVGLDVTLTKEIPSQAGLGGASSDAAAVVLAAQAALAVELPFELASNGLASLGSDCAFFFEASRSGFALCTGRGERVTPIDDAPRAWCVAVLTPLVQASTASVYRALAKHLSARSPVHTLPNAWGQVTAASARTLFFNQLEDAALEAVPELRPWRRMLDACGQSHYRLSGSGSSFFGVFDDCVDARESLERILVEANDEGLSVRGHWISRPRGAAAALAPGASRGEAPADRTHEAP